MKLLTTSILLFLTLITQHAQLPPQRGPFTGTMPAGDGGPRNHRILLASSRDGLHWTIASEALAEQASVPELFEGPEGRPIAIFVDVSGQSRPGALGAMVRGADEKWTRTNTNLRGADPNVVRLKDGTYRGYTKDRDGSILVFSSPNGLQWEQLGVAFQSDRYPNTTDSDVFETPDGWVALISIGPRLLRCTSSDGLKFTTDDTILDLGGSVSDTAKVKGGWRTFFHVNAPPRSGGKMRIRSAFTADGKTWKVEDDDRVVAPASGPASLGVADPAPLQLQDSSWLMLVKSFIEAPARNGPFARQEGGPPSRPSPEGPIPDNRDAGEFPSPDRDLGAPPEDGTPRFPAPGQRPRNPQHPGGASTPREHEVHSATSNDGLAWTRDDGIRLKSASVPCVINDGDNRILLYVVRPPDEPGHVGGVSCAVSTDGMNFTVDRNFRIEGLSTLTAADPSIVKDQAGKFRLYYLASNHRGDPARGENPHKIQYAISDDGIRFREAGTAFTYDDLVDPDVFRYKDQWFMYVFGKGGTVIATSPDGTSFTFNKTMTPRDWGTTTPVLLPDGRLRLYAFEQRVPIGNAVGSFTSTDGLNWIADAGQRLQARSDEQITDPFVIPWRGGWKMYFKHSPARRGGNPRFTPGPPNNFNPQPAPQNINNADGPWNRDVIAYRVSADGAATRAATFERAGVPTLARLQDGRLIVAHQHFPENDPENFDKVAVHFSSDDGHTWGAAQVIQVAGLPEGMRFPFDPTLVPLPDGRIRLYFTGNMGRNVQRSTPAIHSAISTNGVNYTYEPGARFAVAGRAVIDSAVVLHNGVFHLYAPDNGAGDNPGRRRRNEPEADRPLEGVGYHATSEDGLNFTRAEDVHIEGRRRWLGNAQSDGKVITFYGTGEGMNTGGPGGQPRGGLWMATSADGNTWKLVENPPISGGDPGAVRTREGGLLVVITGGPVRGGSRRDAGGPPAGPNFR